MSDTPTTQSPGNSPAPAAPTTTGSAAGARPAPVRTPPKVLPPWKVLLHNDDQNEFDFVVETVQMLVHLSEQDAALRTKEAHDSGVALLTTTHREHAELIQQQFASRNIVVTIEPAETGA